MTSNRELKKIPYYGVGIGLRNEIGEQTMCHKNEIDTLEIISERFFNKPAPVWDYLRNFADNFPIIPHGVKLSIASADKTDPEFLKNMKKLCEFVVAPYYSDHFALTRLPGADIGHLSPIWFTKESLEIIVEKIDTIQDFLGIPLVLENINSMFTVSEADFEEPEFIAKVCERTGCGALLDLTNVYINTHNNRSDPYDFLGRFPLDYVVQIHLAGGMIRNDWFYDTHSEKIAGINDGVWSLLEWTIKRCDIKSLIIERDQNFKDDFDDMLLQDIRRARSIIGKNGSRNFRFN